jgi:hypothetical protein
MKVQTTHAKAAKLIRQELKNIPVIASVRSYSYAGGSSVRISLVDADPKTRKEVEVLVGKYQYGHFDGMNDIYEYSNSRDDLPQAKFVIVENEMSSDMKASVQQFCKKNYCGFDKGDVFKDNSHVPEMGEYATTVAWRVFSGSENGFWE